MVTISGGVSTHRVAYASAMNTLHGIRFATETGTPMNVMLTVDLQWVVDAGRSASQVHREVRARVARWWKDQNDRKGRNLGPLLAVTVQANPGHRHAHTLCRLPPEVSLDEFLGVVVNRLSKVMSVSEDVAADACHLKPVSAPGQVGKYILKGIHPQVANLLHIEPVDEGFVEGRRTSVTRACSKVGRDAAGWVRQRQGRGRRR